MLDELVCIVTLDILLPIPDRTYQITLGNDKLIFRYEYYHKTQKKMVKVYIGENCRSCPYKKQCVKEAHKARKIIKTDEYEKYRKRMSNKMKSNRGREKLKIRSKIVEHPFGDIKQNMGLREFLTRGINKVKIEFNISCIAHNLKRIASFIKNEGLSIKSYIRTAIG